MKGLSIGELEIIKNFILDHHRFSSRRIRKSPLKSMHIKYFYTSYDSRDDTFWRLELGNSFGRKKTVFATNMKASLGVKVPYKNLFNWIMAFLKYEWEPDEDYIKKVRR